jgi:hypothetical protein
VRARRRGSCTGMLLCSASARKLPIYACSADFAGQLLQHRSLRSVCHLCMDVQSACVHAAAALVLVQMYSVWTASHRAGEGV